ncbi:hypothetical protein TRVA0_006S01222 [Trichomonascus vanleenenianus]|uniref:uncharacterized protein n=1 Tax=Trichomonascus vanleenenianus TaxID=2268995 RepID=UPI003ECA9AAF
MVVLALMYSIVISSLYLFNDAYYPFEKPSTVPTVARPEDMEESGFDLTAARTKMIENPEQFQEFDWTDWVDTVEMQKMRKVAYGPKHNWPKEWRDRNPYREARFPPKGGPGEQELAINGRIYLVEQMPKPRKVVFLGENSRIVNIKQSDDEPGSYTNSSTGVKVDSSDDPEDVLIPELAERDLTKKVAVDIPWEMLLFNASEEAQREIDPSWDLERQNHYQTIQTAVKHYKDSPKHFHEIPLGWAGVHYDWRFFNKIKRGEDHEAYRHHLIRTWSEFTEQYGILTWIAHGSMLGWAQNGLSLPWDNDHDVQMPIRELDRFARKFNQTLIVQDPKEGNGRYFIDVGPWYVERLRGNGNNLIDARFVDTRSGIYLDITGLASATEEFKEKKIAHDKNNNKYSLERMSPARRTFYEGAPIYVPNEHEAILTSKFGRFKPDKAWHFDRDLRLFVKNEDCDAFTDSSKKFDENRRLTMYGACDKEKYVSEYERTKLVTKEHYDEIDLYDKYFHVLSSNATEDETAKQNIKIELARLLREYHAPMRYDPL